MEILLSILSSINLTDILVAAIGGGFLYITNKTKKETAVKDAKDEQKEKDRRKESLLIMRMLNANTELTECISLIIMAGDSSICNVQEAKKNVEEAQKDYREFLEELRARDLH